VKQDKRNLVSALLLDGVEIESRMDALNVKNSCESEKKHIDYEFFIGGITNSKRRIERFAFFVCKKLGVLRPCDRDMETIKKGS
jgi:hypothetical protein